MSLIEALDKTVFSLNDEQKQRLADNVMSSFPGAFEFNVDERGVIIFEDARLGLVIVAFDPDDGNYYGSLPSIASHFTEN